MAGEHDKTSLRTPAPALPEANPGTADEHEESPAVLRRIERLLFEIRGRMESTARSERYREFSLARLSGTIAQFVVIALLIMAVVDWVNPQIPPGGQLVRLAFAGVLQLVALTAFILSRDKA